MWTQAGPRNHVLDESADPPWEWTILRLGRAAIVKYRDYRPSAWRCGLLSNYFDHLLVFLNHRFSSHALGTALVKLVGSLE